MAQVKLLKLVSGLPQEMATSADDITLNSFTVQGGGPVLSATGLDLQTQNVSNCGNIDFDDPSADTIEQTAGALIVDNIMAKERENTMTTAGGISFPVISDAAGEVDSFRLPALAGAPSATPTSGGEGHLVWDSTNNKLYAWDGAAWDDLSSVTSAESLDVTLTSAGVTDRDVVYIDNSGEAAPAQADALSTSEAVGFALSTASASDDVSIRIQGVVDSLAGLTAGDRYFVSAASAGSIVNSAPSSSGDVVYLVGYAISTTELLIQKQFIAVRS